MKPTAAVILVTMSLVTGHAWAQGSTVARVGDITRLQGQGTNVLIATGLVTGLPGTGDGDAYARTAKDLATALERLGAPIDSIEDLKGSKSTAIVMLEAVIPEHGAREGDRLDVKITTLGPCKSLAGGRLLTTPMVYQDRAVAGLFAFAQGAVSVTTESPTSGVIPGGARMEQDIFMNVVAGGAEVLRAGIRSSWIQPEQQYITLVLDEAHAGWTMAAAVAEAVDKELGISADVEHVALAVDQKSIVVLLPAHQSHDPVSWIRDVQRTPLLMESNEARVVINRRTRTIVVSGDTRISPVIVSQRGLTITVVAPPPAADPAVPARPVFDQWDFVPLDREMQREPNVSDLLEALNRLKVPFEDRVALLEEIQRAGKLHAKVLHEG
jgi:flagellar P-ring protein precursor FlgI